MARVWRLSKRGVVIFLRVTPKASRNGITGIYVDGNGKASLKVTTTAQPEKGQANKAIIQILAKTFKHAKSGFTVIAGEIDRNKTILISGKESDVLSWLEPALERLENDTRKRIGKTD